jgi:hypothetical protein
MKIRRFDVGGVLPPGVHLTDPCNIRVGRSQPSTDLISSQQLVFRTLQLPNQQTHGDNEIGLPWRGSGSSSVSHTMRGGSNRGTGNVVWLRWFVRSDRTSCVAQRGFLHDKQKL